MKNQPVFAVTQAKAVDETLVRVSVERMPHRMKPTIRAAVTRKTTLSVAKLSLRSSTPTPGTNAGWIPWG